MMPAGWLVPLGLRRSVGRKLRVMGTAAPGEEHWSAVAVGRGVRGEFTPNQKCARIVLPAEEFVAHLGCIGHCLCVCACVHVCVCVDVCMCACACASVGVRGFASGCVCAWKRT